MKPTITFYIYLLLLLVRPNTVTISKKQAYLPSLESPYSRERSQLSMPASYGSHSPSMAILQPSSVYPISEPEKQQREPYVCFNPFCLLIRKLRKYFGRRSKASSEVYNTPLPSHSTYQHFHHQQNYCSKSALPILEEQYTPQTNTTSETADQNLKTIIWREGLLHNLAQLHGSGNCRLSLGDLIDLQDKVPSYFPVPMSLSQKLVAISSTSEEKMLPSSSYDYSNITNTNQGKDSKWPLSGTNNLFDSSTKTCSMPMAN